MAKKSSNPMDAARKAARKRELERNKASRQKVRDEIMIRKDPRPLQAEVRRLERLSSTGNGKLSAIDSNELKEKRAELEAMLRLKEEFVAKHPNSRKLVFPGEEEERAEKERQRKAEEESKMAAGAGKASSGPAGGGQYAGIIPERSVYYDPVFNPTGAPPPGMPYREKPPDQWPAPPLPSSPPPSWPTTFDTRFEAQAGEEKADVLSGDEVGTSNSDTDSDSNSDEDGIQLPEGPPPLPPAADVEVKEESEEDDDDDDDGIVMPSGPPPPKVGSNVPAGPTQMHYTGPPPGFGTHSGTDMPLAAPNWTSHGPMSGPGPFPAGLSDQMRPPTWQAGPSQFRPPPPMRPFPRAGAPRGFEGYAAHAGAGGGVRADPMALNGEVRPTYQSWRARPRPSPHTLHPSPSGPNSVPARAPTGPSASSAAASHHSRPRAPGPPPVRPPTSISAAPQMRDFRKEAAEFVPPALARKRAAQRAQAAKGGLPGMVDAAPASGPRADQQEATSSKDDTQRIGLMDRLKPHLNTSRDAQEASPRSGQAPGRRKKDDEYERFLGDIGDLL
ncbi:Uncharacterized conserved low complexity protein [Ceraceosorus bombacis]|uniref:Uncharacterized conserved low complexity protein n=1 Tax=Ceraceosorus bombacis TaxID=401625 RepID=A0A0P1BMP2_9BASI|nr:Uncharacterized conserved low complexity protein [Ceraceosorus bombacis]